ncbi:MAG TPA: SDR family oxidoreductase [Candidatus Marinimicrobia bacterium]|jgi:short-subunit dehydrogenase|nr:SDR family oxidoreductase [Candidatus Neomarinimicrobiota bacterium]HIM27400.1 SDR family oxidoreductase [Candidatus Neomarinimicrobiota bacterium]
MNKIILITGCSSGFGMLTSARLAAAGHTIYATMRNMQKQDTLKLELKRRNTECHILPLDVTNDNSINKVINTIEKQDSRLDVLINNAGYGIGGFFEDLSEDEIRSQFETNFFGVQKVTRSALPLMRATASKSGKDFSTKIINISSAQGRSTLPGLGAYGASKFALEGFSESLYFELQPFGVEVVILEPGTYSTKAIDDNSHEADAGLEGDSPYANYTKRLKELHNNILITKKGVGDPENVAIMIEDIINRKRNKLRYLAGTQAKIRVLMRTILPFSWFSRIINSFIIGSKN